MSELVSVCAAVYRVHAAPNVAALEAGMAAALDGLDGELVVALNGVARERLGLSEAAVSVDLGTNRGVAPGWNAAAGAAGGDVLVFSNDDVELRPRSLALLARALREQPRLGVAGPVGTLWDIDAAEHRSWVQTAGLEPGTPVACDVVSGFLFATRRETFEALGGFDGFYAPCSYEEVDFCTAARRRLGLECAAIAGVGVAHEWGISRAAPPWRRVRYDGRSETLRSIHRRNRRHFLDKWAAP